jgi:tetratricopeptide (TPR) repeat protein
MKINIKKLAVLTSVIIGLLCFLFEAQARPKVEELILQGNKLCEKGEYKWATAIYKQALKEYNSPDAAYNLGITYEVNLRDMQQAVYYYELYLALEPGSNDAKEVKGWIEEIGFTYFVVSKKAKTLDELPPKLKQRVITDLKHAQDFYRLGEYQNAVENYLAVLEVYDSSDACYNLGLIYDKKLNQKEQAIEYYQQFLVLEPSSPDTDQIRKWIKQAREVLKRASESPKP